MEESGLEFDNISNYRADAFTGDESPSLIGYGVVPAERRQIPFSAPYELQLYEAPQENIPSTTKIILVLSSTELTEVESTAIPANFQYKIQYDEILSGTARFNQNQAGEFVDISYYGLGNTYTKNVIEKITFGGTKTFENVNITGALNVTGNVDANGTIRGAEGEIIEFRDSLGVEGNITIKKKIIEIGSWDMDFSPTKSVAHGMGSSFIKIRSVDILIQQDGSVGLFLLWRADGSPAGGYLNNITSTHINLQRIAGGSWDNTNFSDTSITRGWIIIHYEA